jgi:hypothetical protein
MLIILPIVQLLRLNKQNSLLTTSLVSVFIAYLGFIAQFSYGENNLYREDIPSLVADILCSTFVFILAMSGSIMGGTGQIKITPNSEALNDALGVSVIRKEGANEQKQLLAD